MTFDQMKNLDPHQIGLGLEGLTRWVDLRLNGYIPVGNKSFFKGDKFKGFKGHNAIFENKYKAALPTIEGEIGFPLSPRCRPASFYGAVGSYYLFDRERGGIKLGDAVGGKARIRATFLDILELGLDVTYDRIFHTTVQGLVALSFPLGPRNLGARGRVGKLLCDPITQEVIRNEIIPIQSKKRCFAPCDPNTGQAPCIYFVDNVLGSSDGTYEHPFKTLKEAQDAAGPNDIIYVRYGSGTYNESITIRDNQILQSSAIPFFIGDIKVPAKTPGRYPTFTPPKQGSKSVYMDYMVEMLGDSTIKGFIFEKCSNHAIVNSGKGTISHNFIYNSKGDGIHINSKEPGRLAILDNVIARGKGSGISIESTDASDLDLTLEVNRIRNNAVGISIHSE